MPYVATDDDTDLFIKEWGDGPPVILIHGWPLNADSWDDVALGLANAGFRAISYDRRGFGRSEQTWEGYDYDTFADDLAAVIDQATDDSEKVALVGFSMGGGEVARYLSKHGADQVSHAALIASVVPYMAKTDDNPDGVDASVFDEMVKGMNKDRADFMQTFAETFYGVGWISSPVSQGTLDAFFQSVMMAGLHPTLKAAKAFATTDFRPDTAAFTMPTLILHGTADKTVPIDPSARQAAKMIPHAQLIEYDGAPHGLLVTNKDEVIRDLLAFLQGSGTGKERQALFGDTQETVFSESPIGSIPTLQPGM